MGKYLDNVLFENVTSSNDDFTKHYHNTYTIGLTYKGVLKSFNANQTYDSYEYSIRINNPTEVHGGKSQNWDHVNFYPTVDLVSEVYEQIFGEKRVPYFEQHIVENRTLFLKLHNFFQSYFQKENEFIVETNLIEALSSLILHNTIYTKEYKIILEDRVVKDTYELIKDSLDTNFSLEELAKNVNLSKYHFLRVFKKEFGLTPHAFILNERLNQANRLILDGTPISEASQKVGFNDQSHFTRNFKKYFGYTPSNLRKNSNIIL